MIENMVEVTSDLLSDHLRLLDKLGDMLTENGPKAFDEHNGRKSLWSGAKTHVIEPHHGSDDRRVYVITPHALAFSSFVFALRDTCPYLLHAGGGIGNKYEFYGRVCEAAATLLSTKPDASAEELMRESLKAAQKLVLEWQKHME